MPPANAPAEGKGFFGSLFDFSFQLVCHAENSQAGLRPGHDRDRLGYIVFTISAFTQNPGIGVLVLLVGAVAAIVYLAFIRMTLEFYYAVVRMSEDINRRLPRP